MTVRGCTSRQQGGHRARSLIVRKNRADQSSDNATCASVTKKLGRPSTFYLDNPAALVELQANAPHLKPST